MNPSPQQRILLILGHPRAGSFTEAIARSYVAGAESAGAEVQMLLLHELQFNLNSITPQPQKQEAEPDLVQAKELILWANHLVIASPVWWGSVPALLKGFLDRVFVPGFSFYERREGDYAQLLKGRTGELLLCMDTPVAIYRLFVGAPAVRSLKTATLKLCGVAPVKVQYYTPVTHSAPSEKEAWLRDAQGRGTRAARGIATPLDKGWLRALPWIRALRLQFYPMTAFAYFTGALLAKTFGYSLNILNLLLGYALIFLMEVVAVFVNELQDFRADKLNTSYTPFNGGSRVLVNGELEPRQLAGALPKIGILITLLSAILLMRSGLPIWEPLTAIGGTLLLAVAYTAPPFRLSYRTLGEVTVGITHSLAVILCGFVFQNGPLRMSLPWIISLPLLLSILPSIILSNIPDRLADAQVGKKTLAVRLGAQSAAWVALACTWLAAGAGLWLLFSGKYGHVYNLVLLAAIPHAIWLTLELVRFLRLEEKPETIPKLMVLSLTYMMWFVLVPFGKLV